MQEKSNFFYIVETIINLTILLLFIGGEESYDIYGIHFGHHTLTIDRTAVPCRSYRLC